MSKIVYLEPAQLPSFFKEELKKNNTVFVFQTDVVKNSWADWCVSHYEESGVQAVSLDRFTAWDKFKAENVSSREKDKKTIPSILRTFFVSSLIRENSLCQDNKTIFHQIINPKFRKEAVSFTDWIVSILPSLKLWYTTVTSEKNKDYKMDEEDSDYLELYKRYSDFLEKNNLFEPSWIEPDFKQSGNEYIIFYPELLKDYSDYIDIFSDCEEITIVHLPEVRESSISIQKPVCLKYPDSRKELRRTILTIRNLAEKIKWEEISINIPDLETYRPYLERELTKYCIPFVIKAGFPLTQNTAAKIFTEIQECFESNFSYDSMRNLLLDEYIPWRSDLKDVRTNLIEAGNSLRCICSFNEKENGEEIYFDSWEKALSTTSNTNNRELSLYKNLKHEISLMSRAKSFNEIIISWQNFKKNYLSENEFSKEADAILGRSLTELSQLKEIEKTYCTPESGLIISNHFSFFITELSKKTYTPQNSKNGISVYPYKTSAGAFFSHQFVLDSSQKNLEIQYKKLNFLNDEKRKALNLLEDDRKFNASQYFCRLYHSFEKTSPEPAHFSYAENSFQGFAICHNALQEVNAQNDELDEKDFILNEKNYMLGKNFLNPLKLTQAQINQFNTFRSLTNSNNSILQEESKALTDHIKFKLIKNRHKNENSSFAEQNDKIVITQSDMKAFFPCPRKWIFSKILDLKEESLDTVLMQTFDNGNINHKILELFMTSYLQSQQALPTVNKESGLFDNEEEIYRKIKEYAEIAINEKDKDYAKSPLTRKMLESQIDQISQNIMDFLHTFLKANTCSGSSINTRTKTEGYGGCLVRGVEKEYTVHNNDKNYDYYGKIDLILTSSPQNSASQGWTIIDYKNTSVPDAKSISFQNNKLGDFQMPMYITLIQKNNTIQDIDVSRFYSIKDVKTSCAIDINTKDKSQDNFKETMEAFEKYSDKFEDTIRNQKFQPESNEVDIYEDCIKCNFNAICRKTYEVFRKN